MTREEWENRPLTAEEERAVQVQGRWVAMRIAWEEKLRARGERVPGPFENVDWGD
ncbi:hypothetical protein KIK06_21035 [Nocardiopsis sp. EMB25]|uniref:hypothetical protein n=1 Tax=Nocardiopsis sp. EMB25 TaxID=2835867 RepID=UPI00228488F8|nr:hypothetical protein [Nocardiopsis sp. EMB25]MCY9786383.1 hypothetical protein [Nocardiopsis sp. EMB25]